MHCPRSFNIFVVTNRVTNFCQNWLTCCYFLPKKLNFHFLNSPIFGYCPTSWELPLDSTSCIAVSFMLCNWQPSAQVFRSIESQTFCVSVWNISPCGYRQTDADPGFLSGGTHESKNGYLILEGRRKCSVSILAQTTPLSTPPPPTESAQQRGTARKMEISPFLHSAALCCCCCTVCEHPN